MKFNFEEDVLSVLTEEQIATLKEKFLNNKITKLLEDELVVDFCSALFENNLNVSLTADKVFMHRNTLSYKLNKIYRVTGLDLRSFNDAFLFKILIDIYNKDNSNNSNK